MGYYLGSSQLFFLNVFDRLWSFSLFLDLS